jgi:serine/threonine protein kinase
VGEAHAVDILHRDIKPSNILFSRVGDVLMPKLADFGIARAIRRRPREGEPEDTLKILQAVPLFSPRWAAPEQLKSEDEGPYTDVYALGLVVAFMLQGKPLFEVADVTSTFLDRSKGDAYVRERLALHPLAPELARVIADALRADPRVRTQSPFDFYEALSHAFGTPRASLPSPIAHSGGVPSLPPPRKASESITVEATFDSDKEAQSVAPPERWLQVGGRRVRIVETHERLDLSVPTAKGVDVRFRITLLPAREQLRVNLKGLNCFVRRTGGTLSPALVADSDGTADLVSTQKENLGTLSWTFGSTRGAARVFPVARGELVVPFPQGHHALALELGPERELIVICRRA